MNSRYITVDATDWGPTGKIETYGKQYPVQDCRSGTCFQGYLYYILQRLHSGEPDQQHQRARQTERRHGRALGLSAVAPAHLADAGEPESAGSELRAVRNEH